MQTESCYIDLMKLLYDVSWPNTCFFDGWVTPFPRGASSGWASYQLFCPYVDWNPLRMGCREKKGWVLQATVVPSTMSTCYERKGCAAYIKQCLSTRSIVRDGQEIRIRFGTSRNPSHGSTVGKKALKIDWSMSAKMYLYVGLCDLYWFVAISTTRNRSCNTPGTFWSSSGGSQPLPIHPGRFAEGWGSSHWRRSQIIELNLATVALWKTPCEGLLAILECVGTQLSSLNFLGNYTLAMAPFT